MMEIIVILIFVALLFRRQILRHPRNSFGLVFGIICGYVILKVFMASPGWDTLPLKPWILGLFLLMAVMWGSEIFRKMFDRTWPDDEERDENVRQ